MCKSLKAERAYYYLGKTASTIAAMAIAKAVSRTAEGEEVAEENQIMRDLIHATR